MMKRETKISNIQIKALIVSSIIGVGVLSLPNQLANAMDKDGWIAILLTALLIFPIVLVMIQIFEDNPNKDIFQIGNETFGKPLFTLCLVIYLAYYIAISAYIARTLGELIKAFLLFQTPIRLISFIFILTVAYAAISEIDVIARLAYILYPLTIGFAIILILVALPGSDFTNILPMFQSDLRQLPNGIRNTIFSYAGFDILLFALPYAENKSRKRLVKASIYSIGIVTVIYIALFMLTLTQLSVAQIKADPYPLLLITKLVDLPGYFLQNLDGVIMTIWIMVIFSTMLPMYYSSGKILSKIFNTKSHSIFILILLPIIFLVAFIPDTIVELDIIMPLIINILGTLVLAIIPLALFLVGRIKRRRGRS